VKDNYGDFLSLRNNPILWQVFISTVAKWYDNAQLWCEDFSNAAIPIRRERVNEAIRSNCYKHRYVHLL